MAGFVIPPGDKKSVSLGGVGVVFKISSEETRGSFTVVEHPIDPGILVRPHMHTNEDELSYVLEGEIGVRIEDQIFQAAQGSYIWKPRGYPHTFWNATSKPARLIEFIAPAGLEDFFEQLAGIFQASTPPDMTKFGEIASHFGVLDKGLEWIPELKAKYHLKLGGE